MQLISEEQQILELKIDHLEDLWVLSEFISQDDIIYSSTKRKVALGNDKTKQVTKIIYVELRVLKTNFETDILRVQGEIQNETEFTAIGQSHTLNFNLNNTIKIKKKQLLNYEKKILDKSLNSKSSLNLGVLLDKDEMIAFEFSEYNYKVLFHEKNLGSKKGYGEHIINDEEEKYKLLEPLLKREYSNKVISGPGNFKEKLRKYLLDKGIKVVSFQYYDVSATSVQKCILKIIESGLLENSSLAKEQELINTLLISIEKNSKATYGKNNVESKINEGSVEKLLISTKMIQKAKEDQSFLSLQSLFITLEQLQGEVIIVNSKNEPGKILDGLGGIAALLRY